MSEKELTKEESLKLIMEMIGQAKRNYARGGSFYFLLWGWVVLVANLGHYVMSAYQLSDRPYLIWMITIPAAILSAIKGFLDGKRSRVKSHLDSMNGLIWLAMFICILIILFFMSEVRYNVNPIILTFAGAGTFISGFMLRFKPLIFGGVALWMASIIAFTLPMNEQYLAGAIGIFAGYLIPGYLLKKAENG